MNYSDEEGDPEILMPEEEYRIKLESALQIWLQTAKMKHQYGMSYSQYIDAGPLRAYLRYSKRFLDSVWYDTMTVANVEVHVPRDESGQKIIPDGQKEVKYFKIFVQRFEDMALEEKRTVMFESVVNGNLAEKLKKHGYVLPDYEKSSGNFYKFYKHSEG